MAKIRWTEESLRWLHEIHDYVALDSLRSAQNVISEIYNRIQILSDFPEIGYVYRKESDGVIRILLYGHYRIAYLVRLDLDVTILGIFHSALDISRYGI